MRNTPHVSSFAGQCGLARARRAVRREHGARAVDRAPPGPLNHPLLPPTPHKPAASACVGSAGASAGNNCRYDSSLGMLTKKFLNLIQNAEEGIMDLNQAADILQARRGAVHAGSARACARRGRSVGLCGGTSLAHAKQAVAAPPSSPAAPTLLNPHALRGRTAPRSR